MVAYLSGPIENAQDDGANWRNNITKWLGHELNHQVFNPVVETNNVIKNYDAANFRLMKKSNPESYKNVIREIIKIDLDAVVNKADYLIVKWDTSVFKGGGTHGEVTMAYWLKKPVFLVNELHTDEISSWIFSCSEFVFNNFNELKIKLKEFYG